MDSLRFHNSGIFFSTNVNREGISTQCATTKWQALYITPYLQGSVKLGCNKIFDHSIYSVFEIYIKQTSALLNEF